MKNQKVQKQIYFFLNTYKRYNIKMIQIFEVIFMRGNQKLINEVITYLNNSIYIFCNDIITS